MQKNGIYEGIIENIGKNGEGIIKDNGYVVFVPYTVLGEKIRYKALKVDKKIVYAKVLEVLTPSPERVEPVCSVFTKCGGCQLQHVKYDAQLKIKRQTVEDCFRKIAFIDTQVEKTVACENPYGYRNKLQLPVANSVNGVAIGFYAENSHRVVEIDDCPINPAWTKRIITAFRKYALEFAIKGYDGITGKGELREITAKEIDGKLIIVAVVTDINIRGKARLLEILKESISEEFSLFFNENKSRSNVIYGDKFSLYYGAPSYSAKVSSVVCTFGVQSFMQVNDTVRQKLYERVVEEIGNEPNQTVIDAYSGAGLMTAMLAKKAKRAVGIEIVKEAVDHANRLAKENGLDDKIKNYCGKCEDLLGGVIAQLKGAGDKFALVLDPPRKGCDKAVIDAVINSEVDKIVYVSCMPSTLARDIGLIVGTLEYKDNQIVKTDGNDLRYEVQKIIPFDMFPQTKHVETLVVLSHNKLDV